MEDLIVNNKRVLKYMLEMQIKAIYPGPNLSRRNHKEMCNAPQKWDKKNCILLRKINFHFRYYFSFHLSCYCLFHSLFLLLNFFIFFYFLHNKIQFFCIIFEVLYKLKGYTFYVSFCLSFSLFNTSR